MRSSVEAIDMNQGDVFIDKKSGRQFRLFKYFDHEVIQDVETGWINAGRFVRDIGEVEGKSKYLEHFKATKDYQVCLEYMRTMNEMEKRVVLNDEISYKLNKGIGKGSMVHTHRSKSFN